MPRIGSPYRKHHGLEGSFDVIVVGSGMGGMTAATILAKYGRRVLLLEQNMIVGGLTQSYSRDGYSWNTGLHYIGDVDMPRKMTRQLFDYLTNQEVRWAPLPKIYNRMIVSGKSYEIPAGMDAYREALIAWFPHESIGIDAYLSDVLQASRASRGHFSQKALPSAVVKDQWDELNKEFHLFSDFTTEAGLKRHIQDEDLIAVICSNWGDYSAPPSRSSYAMHCMLNKHYMDGGSYPVGGASRLAETMLPVVEANGGQVVYGAKVEEILVQGASAKGVRLVSGEVIECATVVSNAGVRNTFGRLLGEAGKGLVKAAERLESVDDTYAVVGLNIGMDVDLSELHLDSANLWVHPTSDFDHNLECHRLDFDAPFPWLFITFPSAKDPDWKRRYPGKSTIEMYAYTNYEHFASWEGTNWHKRGPQYEDFKERIKTRLLCQLMDLVPNVVGHIDVVEVSTPLTYETFVCRERGGFMGIESNPQRFRKRWLRAPTEVNGLFLTGQDVTTDGVIGALMGGVIASSAILQRDVMSDIRSQAVSGVE